MLKAKFKQDCISGLQQRNSAAVFKKTDAGKRKLPFKQLNTQQMQKLTILIQDDQVSLDFINSINEISEKGIIGYKPIFDTIINVSGNNNHHSLKRIVEEESKIVDDYLKLSPTFGEDLATDLIMNSNRRSADIDVYIKNTKYFNTLKPIFGENETRSLLIGLTLQELQKIASRTKYYPKLKEYFGEQEAKDIIKSTLLNDKTISILLSSPEKRIIYTTTKGYILANKLDIPNSIFEYMIANLDSMLELVNKLSCLKFYKLILEHPKNGKLGFTKDEVEKMIKTCSEAYLQNLYEKINIVKHPGDNYGGGFSKEEILSYSIERIKSGDATISSYFNNFSK